MQTLKKRNVKDYTPKVKLNKKDGTKVSDEKEEDIELGEVGELDELVNGMGAEISGDEKNVNNTEIKTAPQATTDQFADVAIQPNRYLYNVGGVGITGSRTGTNISDNYEIAKAKMINLLEGITDDNLNTITDFNNNNVLDIDELPPNVARKLIDLVNAVSNNNLPSNLVDIILNYINSKLKNDA